MTEFLDLSQTAQRLCDMDNVLILCHKNPDGDTLGCGAALYWAFHALNKQAAVLCNDPIPAQYDYLNIECFEGQFTPAHVVAVDVAGIQLFGDALQQYVDQIELCIDHHSSNSGYADATLLDADAAAASEIMYDLLGQMGVEITAQIADCLYTGIATDTGCFRFANTTARSHITAAWLMEAGARASELNARLFESKKPQRVEAERLALNNLEYYFDGRCALIYLTREDILSSGVAPSDLEDLTSLPRAIEGVEVGLTLRQQPGGSYKISVRTTDEVDACAIAKRLGGGGHVRAAGCELMGNLDNAKAAVLAEVKKELVRCEQKE